MPKEHKPCQHPNGDTVRKTWICGHCWAKLEDRPKRYGPDLTFNAGCSGDARQVIIWRAPVISSCGMTLSRFLHAIAREMQARSTGLSLPDALDLALVCVRELGIPFGDPEMDWSEAAAKDIAHEEMGEWEQDDDEEGMGNG